MLREIAAGQVWTADMPVSKGGFDFGARMTVVRLPQGELWVHSPVALGPDLKKALDDLGPVRSIVAPARFHFEHAAEFARAYPKAHLYCSPGLAGKLKTDRPAKVLTSHPEPEWRGALDQSPFRGSPLYEEVDFYHPASGTLIVTDLLFNIPQEQATPATRFWSAVWGIAGGVSASRSFRLFAWDRKSVRESVERIDAWEFDRILLSHGDIVERDAKNAFERAFAGLL